MGRLFSAKVFERIRPEQVTHWTKGWRLLETIQLGREGGRGRERERERGRGREIFIVLYCYMYETGPQHVLCVLYPIGCAFVCKIMLIHVQGKVYQHDDTYL